jgi:hypothetical protein
VVIVFLVIRNEQNLRDQAFVIGGTNLDQLVDTILEALDIGFSHLPPHVQVTARCIVFEIDTTLCQGNRMNVILMTHSPFCAAPNGAYRLLLAPFPEARG